jgi:hypothetical protein
LGLRFFAASIRNSHANSFAGAPFVAAVTNPSLHPCNSPASASHEPHAQPFKPPLDNQRHVLQYEVDRSRSKQLWDKVRTKVVRGAGFAQLLHTLRAMHNNSLAYVHSYNGFSAPATAVEFIIQHSKVPNFASFWLDAHCLSEDEARKLQRAFGFHSKTFSMLYNRVIGCDALKYEREVRRRDFCAQCV